MQTRFVIGIDLGTTNSALAFVDTGAGDNPAVQTFAIPQVVNPGEVAARPLLPSSLYLPGPNEQPAGALKLPWDAERDYAVGAHLSVQAAKAGNHRTTRRRVSGVEHCHLFA